MPGRAEGIPGKVGLMEDLGRGGGVSEKLSSAYTNESEGDSAPFPTSTDSELAPQVLELKAKHS